MKWFPEAWQLAPAAESGWARQGGLAGRHTLRRQSPRRRGPVPDGRTTPSVRPVLLQTAATYAEGSEAPVDLKMSAQSLQSVAAPHPHAARMPPGTLDFCSLAGRSASLQLLQIRK